MSERVQRAFNKLMDRRTVPSAMTGKVVAVNGTLCDVEPNDGGAVYFDVRLRVSVNDDEAGAYAVPMVGSQVVMLQLGASANSMCVVAVEDIKEWIVKANGGAELRLKPGGAISINGDQYGGLVKVQELRTDLTKVNTFLTTLREAIQSAPVAPGDGGAAFKAALMSAIAALQVPTYTNIESTKTKHGGV
jgi:phage gp45-like